MELVKTENLERAVHKADELATLDEITQRALELAKAMIKNIDKAKEKKEDEDGGRVQEQSVHGPA